MNDFYDRKQAIIVFFCLCMFLFCIPSVKIISDQDEYEKEEKEIIENLTILQDNFYILALAHDYAVLNGYHQYLIPDWMFYPDKESRNMHYEDLNKTFQTRKRLGDFAKRIDEKRRSFHFDALRLFDYTKSEITTGSLKRLRNGDSQIDPFAPESLLGYISTPVDYCLISIGTDEDSDILGFSQLINGKYAINGKILQKNDRRSLKSLGLKLYITNHHKYKSQSNWDPRDWNARIDISKDKIYDPTNGINSNGDIVFQRSAKNGNFLLEYPSYGDDMINKNNIYKRNLKSLF